MRPELRRVARALRNPLVVVAAVVAVLTAGWTLYVGAGSDVAQARPGANLFPALESTAAGAAAGPAPTASADSVGGWNASHGGDAESELELVDGRVSDRAVQLEVPRHVSGEVTLTSPRVDVEPGRTYLFKAFTTHDADVTVLARRYHPDGTTTLEKLEHLPVEPRDAPRTVSDAFDSADTTAAVEYVFRLASAGTVRVEGAYLEAADDIRVPSTTAAAEPNLVPNPGLAVTRSGAPDSWSPYVSGKASVTSGRTEDEDGSFLWTRISDHKSGEAKWEYRPVPVTPDQPLEFGVTYRSEREVDVVAEFELENGEWAFHHLATEPPTEQWTTIRAALQAPAGAKTVMVSVVSRGDGTTGVRDHSLIDVTRPGPLRWDRPMVSITFDDGWKSVYDRALPTLDEHGFPSTQYVSPGTIETPQYMTADQLQRLHEAGHEIAAHSFSHVDLTALDVGKLDEELRKSDEMLEAAGLPTDGMAAPFGKLDPQVDWYARRYFELVRGTSSGINTRQNLDPSDLTVFYVTDRTTTQELEAALAETARVDGWLILVYHQIAPSASAGVPDDTLGADGSTVTSDVFAAHVELVADSGIDVQTVTRAFEQLQADGH